MQKLCKVLYLRIRERLFLGEGAECSQTKGTSGHPTGRAPVRAEWPGGGTETKLSPLNQAQGRMEKTLVEEEAGTDQQLESHLAAQSATRNSVQ